MMLITNEDWRPVPVPGYEAFYQVSSLGRVQSIRTLRFCTPYDKKGGYKAVSLHNNSGPPRRVRVHVLVLGAFVGPRPDGLQAGHLNGKRADNRLCNLRWVTKQENEFHKNQHGTSPIGERNHEAKLTIGQVLEIRRLKSEGLSYSQLSRQFGVSPACLWNIMNGRGWVRALAEHDGKGRVA